MCSLFGIIDYDNALSAREKNRILSVLGRECEIRGTDATGIAYNFGPSIHIYKRPLAARKMRFRVPNGVNVIMGHTRMTTQGSAKRNYNNHPWATAQFALAHNGVLWNDGVLREKEPLPTTHIETDSYVAVQLLEQQKALNFETIQKMAEKVRGSFVFTILDRKNNLYFVRGDNPLAIFDYGGFYLYASTAEILGLAERRLNLHHRNCVQTEEGDILKIARDGTCSWSRFRLQPLWPQHYRGCSWYLDEISEDYTLYDHYLMNAAKSLGVPEEDVQLLLDYGYGIDEIEELLYEPELRHDIMSAILCDWGRGEVNLWV